MVGIITNPAANAAQKFLGRADSSITSSVSRLSSGNRIVKSSDDVAGLAVGKVFETNVTTQKAALTNAAQASSLLSVADGGLENIGSILQRQKALATQATSGSLNDQTRGYLNQEFVNLKNEINRIATKTNFSGINLIDGSLFNAAKVTSNVTQDSKAASGALVFAGVAADGDTINFHDTDADVVNGFSTVTFTAQASGGLTGGDDSFREFLVGGDVNAQAANFMTMVENLRKYSGSDATTLAAKEAVMAYDFAYTSGTDEITMTARSAGTVWNNVDFKCSKAAVAELDGTDINAATGLGDAGIKGTTSALPGGSHSAGGTIYSAHTTTQANQVEAYLPSVYAQGVVGDTILRDYSATNGDTTGVNFAGISNNSGFVGKMNEIKAEYFDDDIVNLEVEMGDTTYYATAVPTNSATATPVVFYSLDEGKGTFTLNLRASGGIAVTDQTEADIFASRINKALSSIDVYQRREISNYQPAGSVFAEGGTTAIGDLSGSKFWLVSDDFSDSNIEDVRITAPKVSGQNFVMEIIINGEVYRSGFNFDGQALAIDATDTNASQNTAGQIQRGDGGIGNTGTSLVREGLIGFVNQTNPNKILQFDYVSSTALNLSTESNAKGAVAAFKQAFGIDSGRGVGLKFQVGTTADDAVDVQIEGVKAGNIYLNEEGNYQDITIDTQLNAETANGVIDNAIAKVLSVRAQIGSLQSRFDFAKASIQSSIENQDAARSLFLDTDVSGESTQLAQAQVRLQASISVLAQANQVPQTYLKLIG